MPDPVESFDEYLASIPNTQQSEKLSSLLISIQSMFPQLRKTIAWKQVMFMDHGTFIIGFSVSKANLLVAPEAKALEAFSEELDKAGISHTKQMFRIPWDSTIDVDLLSRVIHFNIEAKRNVTTFWWPKS